MKLGRIAASLVSLAMVAGLASPAVAAPVPESNTDGYTDVRAENVMEAMFSDYVTQAPKGVNDWSCKLTPQHPKPIILLHGAYMSTYTAWSDFGPRLAEEGFCVYSINYGREEDSVFAKLFDLNGTGAIDESVEQVSVFVKAVVEYTGAEKATVVGYSEGGLQGQLMLKRYGSKYVDRFITIGGVQKGTTLLGIAKLIPQLQSVGVDVTPLVASIGGQGTNDMVVESDIVKEANAGGDVIPGVQYTAISSKYDGVAYPLENTQFTPGPNVKNIVLQDTCSKDFSDHLSQVYSERVYALLLNELYAKQVVEVPCQVVLPFLGTTDK
ncbi:MAG: alpha/beta fold hydrolase [Lawsonella sp.]